MMGLEPTTFEPNPIAASAAPALSRIGPDGLIADDVHER
jgi:hypothetical protein